MKGKDNMEFICMGSNEMPQVQPIRYCDGRTHACCLLAVELLRESKTHHLLLAVLEMYGLKIRQELIRSQDDTAHLPAAVRTFGDGFVPCDRAVNDF